MLHRIQLDLPLERVRELDELMSALNISTRKELINSALTLFEWAVKEKRAGRAIASVDEAEDKIREVLMPVLERLAAPTATGGDVRGMRPAAVTERGA